MRREKFVYLAYLDESDTRAKSVRWQVMSSILIEDKRFKYAEIGVAGVVESIIPPERLPHFEEFHACELYGGYGVFQEIPQDIRFQAISRLLSLIKSCNLSVIYGAVDLDRLQGEVCASADPLDACFRMCLKGICQWADDHTSYCIDTEMNSQGGFTEENRDKLHGVVLKSMIEELVMLIMDDCENKKTKEMLHKTFRSVRPKFTLDITFQNLHDDMYFGDSRHSIGIQLADLCSYFIARHLGGEAEIDGFYSMIEPNIHFRHVFPPIPPALSSLGKIGSGGLHESPAEQSGVLALHRGVAEDTYSIED